MHTSTLQNRRKIFVQKFLGFFFVVATLGFAPGLAQAMDLVDRTSVTLGWSPAEGPVAGYAVYFNRNGLGFAPLPELLTDADETSVTISGEPGDRFTIRVAGFTEDSQIGAFSPVSDEVHFVVSDVLAAYDFDGDGRSDLAWLQSATGEIVVSDVAGNAVQPVWLPEGGMGAGWVIAGSGDFDGDGAADLLIRNSRSGANLIWRMSGDSVLQQLTLESVTASYRLQGVGDFNADGRDDLLWRNSRGGSLEIWLLNGAQILSREALSSAAKGWSVAAVADFDGDGKADILWRNSKSGATELWFMDGTVLARSAVLPLQTKTWLVQSVADVDGDARPDIVWQNAQGFNEVWRMDSATVRSKLTLPAVSRKQWKLVRAGDFDGDGFADLLWYSPSTQTTLLWKFNASGLVSATSIAGAPGKGWLAGK